MPYGKPPDGPKSGCRRTDGPPMLPSQVALLGWTGRLETSGFQTLLAGKTGQPPMLGAAATVAGGQAASVTIAEIPRALTSRARSVRVRAAMCLSLGVGGAAAHPRPATIWSQPRVAPRGLAQASTRLAGRGPANSRCRWRWNRST